jgi:trimeric autotransporter adhesin
MPQIAHTLSAVDRRIRIGVLVVVFSAFAPSLHSQQIAPPPPPTATLSGEVKTAEQLPVPGATLRVTDLDTGQAWVSWTDESGKFELPSLPEGHYHVEVSQLGFGSLAQDLQLPSSGTVILTLHVVTVAELSATTTAGSVASKPKGTGQPQAGNSGQDNPNVNSQSSLGRRGQAPPPGVMNALRQGMGGFQQTDLTGQGGEAGTENSVANSANSELSAGAPAGATNSSDVFVLQGAVGQGVTANGPIFLGGPGQLGSGGGSFIPNLPGGQQGPGGGGPMVRTGQGGGPGGGSGGGPVMFAQGSGGSPPMIFGGGRGRMARQMVNQVRFTLFDRYENSAFDARPYSITGVQSPKISHYDERVGGALGGPLKIPHIYNGADRTYFFVNYQHEISQSPVDAFSTVPTMDERNGNFCTSSTPVELFDPTSNISGPRMPLGNGCQIPTINSAAAGLLDFIPLPNVPCPDGVCPTVQNYHLQATTPLNADTVNLHVLHTINSKWNANGGYNLSSQRIDTLGNFPSIKGTQSSLGQGVSLGLSHNWTSQFVENLHLNWSRNRIQVLSDNSYVNNVAGNLGINGVSVQPINWGIPAINFTDFSGLNDPVPSLVRNQTVRYGDSFSWVRKKHTYTFGGEIRRIELNDTSDPIARGQFTFTGLMTAQLNANGSPVPGTGDDLADFLLGYPYNTRVQFGDANTYFRSWGFVAFAQDDFRVNKNFTFLYGVRYEAVTPPVELYNHVANLDLSTAIPPTGVDLVIPNGAGEFFGSYPRALIHGDYGNWAPRIGFAWQPFHFKPKTVVRGGYSIFYNESAYNTLAQQYLAYQPPFSIAQNIYTSPTQVLTLQNGFPSSGPSSLPPCSPQLTTNCTPISNTGGVNPFYKVGYAQIWSLGTETELTHTWLLDLTYTGTKGTNLDLLRAPNRAPLGTNPLNTQDELQIPYAASFYYDQSGANSIYNALQVRLMHRFTSGVLLQLTYTFSKALDNASTIGGTSAVVVQQDGNYAGQYGLSSFDMRHQIRIFSVYELPFGERHSHGNHGWTEHVLSNWRILNNITWHTGTPYTALLGGAASNNSGTGANFSERADQIADPNIGLCGGPPLGFFNTAAFVTPPAGQYGDAQRNSIEGPCSFNWNFSIGKSFRFGPDQRHHFDARWEINNLTNTPTFTGLSTTLGSTFFGRVSTAGTMRTMDINLRFNF